MEMKKALAICTSLIIFINFQLISYMHKRMEYYVLTLTQQQVY